MNKATKKLIFSIAALSFLAFAALPIRAAVIEPIESCVLNKPIKLKTRTVEITLSKGITITSSPTVSVLGEVADVTSSKGFKEWGILCAINIINTIIGWIVLIVTIISVGLLVYAGFLWMTGGDNPENKQKAGKVILAALIGFGIVILGNVIPALISGVLLP